MDERLERALDISNYMISLNNQKRIIKEKFLENCMHYLGGGKFTVDRELINFCHTLLQNHQTSAVLIDDNGAPIEVEDLKKFIDEILNIYFTNSYEYLDKYNEIKKNRNVKDLVDL